MLLHARVHSNIDIDIDIFRRFPIFADFAFQLNSRMLDTVVFKYRRFQVACPMNVKREIKLTLREVGVDVLHQIASFLCLLDIDPWTTHPSPLSPSGILSHVSFATESAGITSD